MKKVKSMWLRLSIGAKMGAVIAFLLFVASAAGGINIYYRNLISSSAGDSLNAITLCENVQEAMIAEENAFRAYMQEKSDSNQDTYREACRHMEEALEDLPYSFAEIGEERYVRTWNLRNAYDNYKVRRDAQAALNLEYYGSVSELYKVYDIQNYLDNYILTLLQQTVKEGTARYEQALPRLKNFTKGMWLVLTLILLLAGVLGRITTDAFVLPVRELSKAANRIEQNDFGGEDVVVENEDEIGELVAAFNSMKHATENNIRVMQENQRLEEQLRSTQLDLLQSQINPHFLFNTLNTIAGMAELEDASSTNRMIRALSNIFRYNLHTSGEYVSLTSELNVVRDYIFLQRMRFGDRLSSEVTIEHGVDTDRIMVPVFILQPLVENAIGHGLSKKVEGGSISIEVRRSADKQIADKRIADKQSEDSILVIVRDTGVGISKQKLEVMLAELEGGHVGEISASGCEERPEGCIDRESEECRGSVGIGIGNVYRRIHAIYKTGDMKIESVEGKGTTVTLILPQETTISEV